MKAVVHNVEIEANKIISNVRAKNAFKQSAQTTITHDYGVPKMVDKQVTELK